MYDYMYIGETKQGAIIFFENKVDIFYGIFFISIFCGEQCLSDHANNDDGCCILYVSAVIIIRAISHLNDYLYLINHAIRVTSVHPRYLTVILSQYRRYVLQGAPARVSYLAMVFVASSKFGASCTIFSPISQAIEFQWRFRWSGVNFLS